VIGSDGKVKKHELRLPKKSELTALVAVGDDLAVNYRDNKYEAHVFWMSNRAQVYDGGHAYYGHNLQGVATVVNDGSVFLGQQAVRPGDKQLPAAEDYFHDGERFWRPSWDYEETSGEHLWHCHEIDPHTGKPIRESVPPWFEETEGGTIHLGAS